MIRSNLLYLGDFSSVRNSNLQQTFSALGFLVSQWVESLAQKKQEQRPTSGGESVDTKPQNKNWKNLKFLLDVDKPIKVTVV